MAKKTREKALKGGNTSAVLEKPKRARKKPDVQAAVNGLYVRYGANVAEWPEWPELLKKSGLKPSDVKAIHKERAAEHAEQEKGRIQWPLEPTYETNHECTYEHWVTACKRYRVSRVRRRYQGEYDNAYFVAMVWETGEGYANGGGWSFLVLDRNRGYRPKPFDDLSTAGAAVEVEHKKATGREVITSNLGAAVDAAERAGLSERPSYHRKSLKEQGVGVEKHDAPRDEPPPRVRSRPAGGQGKDAHGCVVGSQSAQINEGVSANEYRSVPEIARRVGIPEPRVKSHVRFWTKRDVMVEKDGKYKFK